MSDFVLEAVAQASESYNGRIFPLPRAENLKLEFSKLFSRHLGHLRGGHYFEGEVLLVTGSSGAGKTTELEKLMREFNKDRILLPNGSAAQIPLCLLDRKGTWKDLGRNTLVSMGYPLSDGARVTQAQIARRITQQGELQGVIGVWYDEAQHVLARKSDVALEEVLDCFKTMLKGPEWPMLLILSGVPELAGYIPKFEQLARKVTHVSFEDINFEEDAETINDVVGSYALEAELVVADQLVTGDFLHRLVTAGAFRWGLVFDMINMAITNALTRQSDELTNEHFVEAWVSKTGMSRAATPFTHSSYVTMFRRDRPFAVSVEN